MKRSSTSEVISAMKIKWQWNTTTHQLEWQKSRKLMALNAGKDVKQHKLSFYLVKMKHTHTHTHTHRVWPGWKTICWFLTKLNILLLYNWAILLLGIYLKELKTHVYTTTCRWMLTAALFIIAETWKQPRCLS